MMNPMTGGKTCWSIFKALLNNKKVPCNISPLFHGNKYVTDLDKIPELFKGCVHYIFACLFCMSKREQSRNKEKCFLFHLKSSFRS